MPNFKLYNQAQSMLLPPSLSDCLPQDHICFVLNDVVENMDLRAIEATYSDIGSPAYNPKLLIKVLFYGYIQGVRSSRKLEAKLYEDIGYRFLAANSQPDHGTINLFRKSHLRALNEIFPQIVMLSGGLGMVDFSDVSIDGTKIKADASKKNLFDQAEIDRLKQKVSDFFREAEALDQEEDKRFGASRGYNAMPADLIDPKKRQEAIRKLKEKLEKLKGAEKKIADKQAKVKAKEDKALKKNSTSNTTDADANLMRMKDRSYQMAYNAQIAASKQVILAYDVHSDSDDHTSLIPMIQKTEYNTGKKIKTVKADAGYCGKDNLSVCKNKQIEAYIPDTMKTVEEGQARNNEIPKYDQRNFRYDEEQDHFICPMGERLRFAETKASGSRKYVGKNCARCPVKEKCAKGKQRTISYDHEAEKQKEIMREKLNSEHGKNKYLERMSEVEPVFGNIIRNLHFRHFQCRGKPMVKIELGLVSCAHNLVKIFNYIKRKQLTRKDIQWNTLMRLGVAE
jgi:transposase